MTISSVTGLIAPGESIVINGVFPTTPTNQNVGLGGAPLEIVAWVDNSIVVNIPENIPRAWNRDYDLTVEYDSTIDTLPQQALQSRTNWGARVYSGPAPDPGATESFYELILNDYGITLTTGDQIQFSPSTGMSIDQSGVPTSEGVFEGRFSLYRDSDQSLPIYDQVFFITEPQVGVLEKLSGGFGRNATGGAAGTVLKVTNLNDSGPGSFRAAIESAFDRIIVFEVGGDIHLESPLVVRSPNVTIAGQTAPGKGITLYNEMFQIRASNVICRHFRVRPGDEFANGNKVTSDVAGNRDGLSIRAPDGGGQISDIILDNMSVGWSIDEAISVTNGVERLSILNTLISEPLHNTVHPQAPHSYGLLITEANEVTLAGMLFSHFRRRSPRMDSGLLLYTNNIVYNSGGYRISTHGDLSADVLNSTVAYPIDPANRYDGFIPTTALFTNRTATTSPTVYFEGNNVGNNLLHATTDGVQPLIEAPSRMTDTGMAIYAESNNSELINRFVGAFPAYRDNTDARAIDDLNNGTGSFINSQDDVGGYEVHETVVRELNIPSAPSDVSQMLDYFDRAAVLGAGVADITAPSQITVNENDALSSLVTINSFTGTPVLTGDDAGHFELVAGNNQEEWILQFNNNSRKDFEAPDDVDFDRVYRVSVSAGYVSHSFNIQVQDADESLPPILAPLNITRTGPVLAGTEIGVLQASGYSNIRLNNSTDFNLSGLVVSAARDFTRTELVSADVIATHTVGLHTSESNTVVTLNITDVTAEPSNQDIINQLALLTGELAAIGSRVNEIPTNPLLTTEYTAPDNTGITDVLSRVNSIPTNPLIEDSYVAPDNGSISLLLNNTRNLEAAQLNLLDAINSSESEINTLSGVINSVVEQNSGDGESYRFTENSLSLAPTSGSVAVDYPAMGAAVRDAISAELTRIDAPISSRAVPGESVVLGESAVSNIVDSVVVAVEREGGLLSGVPKLVEIEASPVIAKADQLISGDDIRSATQGGFDQLARSLDGKLNIVDYIAPDNGSINFIRGQVENQPVLTAAEIQNTLSQDFSNLLGAIETKAGSEDVISILNAVGNTVQADDARLNRLDANVSDVGNVDVTVLTGLVGQLIKYFDNKSVYYAQDGVTQVPQEEVLTRAYSVVTYEDDGTTPLKRILFVDEQGVNVSYQNSTGFIKQ